MPTARQSKAMKLYAALMEELKARVGAIEVAANGETGLPDRLAFEFCHLQLRVLCELLALACLTAHGDIDETQTQRMQKAYSPDKILARLEALHPMFFPCPVVMRRSRPGVVEMRDAESDFMTRTDVASIYGRCGDALHRGSARNLAPLDLEAAIDFSEIVKSVQRFFDLLGTHTIVLFDDQAIICGLAAGPDGIVKIELLRPK